MYQSLSRDTLPDAVTRLCALDSLMHRLVQAHGSPPLWQRTQSFETLVQIILEQKVSLASAMAVMLKVKKLSPSMTAEAFLELSEDELRAAGVSGRKVSYCASIASALISGVLDLRSLRRFSNEDILEKLNAIRGVGPWTSGVYLLMAIRREDAWPSGDRALVVSYAESSELSIVPSYRKFDEIAMQWQPLRGVAARVLWHAYLSRREK
ncbi:MAG: DNA-3-methyladenine glycosylase II [bacterium]